MYSETDEYDVGFKRKKKSEKKGGIETDVRMILYGLLLDFPTWWTLKNSAWVYIYKSFGPPGKFWTATQRGESDLLWKISFTILFTKEVLFYL